MLGNLIIGISDLALCSAAQWSHIGMCRYSAQEKVLCGEIKMLPSQREKNVATDNKNFVICKTSIISLNILLFAY